MTQPSSPVPSAPAADELLDGSQDGGRNLLHDRKALLLIGAAVAALIALAVFVVVPAISGSSPASNNAAMPVHRVQRTFAVDSAAPAVIAAPVLAVAEPQVRDPFSPLYTPPPPPPPATAASAAPSPTTPVASGSAPSSQTIQLVQVSSASQQAEVTINSAVYVVRRGVPFGGSFELLSVTTKSATFDFGDQPFTLTLGQSQSFA